MNLINIYARAVLIFLCCAVSLVSCNNSTENTGATSALTSTPSSAPHAAPLQTETPTAIPSPTPKPVQRKDVRIIGLMIGTGLDKRNEIQHPTSKYHSADSIFAIVRTEGSGPDATIKLRCKDAAGNIVYEESKKITARGSAVTPFALTSDKKFTPGEYHLEGLLDEYPTMAVSIEVSN